MNEPGVKGYVLPISEVVQGTLLVNDPHGSLLCPDANGLDVIAALSQGLQLVVKDVCCFDGSLSVELGRI